VAALAERAEVLQPVISWIIVKMCRRKYNTSQSKLCGLYEIGPSGHATLAIPQSRRLLVKPSSVRQTTDEGEMWPPTALAPGSGALKTNVAAQLMPVWRIEWAQFGANRHGYLLSKRALDRVLRSVQ
jgi:hypothetical protein